MWFGWLMVALLGAIQVIVIPLSVRRRKLTSLQAVTVSLLLLGAIGVIVALILYPVAVILVLVVIAAAVFMRNQDRGGDSGIHIYHHDGDRKKKRSWWG